MKRKIYDLVEPPSEEAKADWYDTIMLLIIVASIIPMAFKESNPVFFVIEKISTGIFIIDYVLRWATADIRMDQGPISYVKHPFTPMALIDLLSILPGVIPVNASLRLFRLVRLIRMFRLFRIFKAMRYSKSISLIVRVLVKQKDSLFAVCYLAGGYILVSALIIFNVEPETFPTFFDAVYWATVSLTTVGYGDVFAVSTVGRIVTMISSIFGIAVVAMPAGIITAGILDELG